MTQVLISQHGNHSPEKWAVATAAMIFPIDESNLSGERLLEAKRKEMELIELLAKHHAWHQNDEKSKLNDDPSHLLNTIESDAEAITSKVIELMHGSSFQDHFTDIDVQVAVRDLLRSHTITNRYTERSWFADGRRHCEFARRFKEGK